MIYFDARNGWGEIDDFMVDYDCGDLEKDYANAGYPRRLLTAGGEFQGLIVYSRSSLNGAPFKHPYEFIVQVELGNDIRDIAVRDFISLVELLNKLSVFFPSPLEIN